MDHYKRRGQREGSAQVVGCSTQNEASFGLFRFNRKPSVFNPKNQLLNGFQIWKLKLNLKPEETVFLVRFGFFGSVFGFRFGFAQGEWLFKKNSYDHTRSIYVMHSNERGECVRVPL